MMDRQFHENYNRFWDSGIRLSQIHSQINQSNSPNMLKKGETSSKAISPTPNNKNPIPQPETKNQNQGPEAHAIQKELPHENHFDKSETSQRPSSGSSSRSSLTSKSSLSSLTSAGMNLVQPSPYSPSQIIPIKGEKIRENIQSRNPENQMRFKNMDYHSIINTRFSYNPLTFEVNVNKVQNRKPWVFDYM